MCANLIDLLPKVEGEYRENFELSKINWFRVGGLAEVMFLPKNTDDLARFIKNKPTDIPITIVGVGSNLLVRDGGIKGITIRLGGDFSEICLTDKSVIAGALTLSFNVSRTCYAAGIGGFEFLSAIPGTIGGALSTNSGAYGYEIADVFKSAEAINEYGEIVNLSQEDMGFTYRGNSIPDSWIFTKAVLKGENSDKKVIAKKMKEIASKKAEAQPIYTRTSGSTFINPDPEMSGGKKAWQLIDEAGCRGLVVGGAKCSEKHCNFLINTGSATAMDIENLGEKIRKMVLDKTGVKLKWEIQIIGEKRCNIA